MECLCGNNMEFKNSFTREIEGRESISVTTVDEYYCPFCGESGCIEKTEIISRNK